MMCTRAYARSSVPMRSRCARGLSASRRSNSAIVRPATRSASRPSLGRALGRHASFREAPDDTVGCRPGVQQLALLFTGRLILWVSGSSHELEHGVLRPPLERPWPNLRDDRPDTLQNRPT